MRFVPFQSAWIAPALAGFLMANANSLCRAQGPAVSPRELVRQTVRNEIDASGKGAKFMFRDRKETPRGSETKLMVETRDAMAGLLIAVNDRPLAPEQRQAESARVERFVNDPGQLKLRQMHEKEDAERTDKIMRALPEALLYQYAGTEPPKPGLGKPGDTLTRLNFRPDPAYNPPSHVEQVLVGMGGYLLIDEKEHRIAKIDGTLQKDVGFGWGILGHLDRGGHFLVQQADVGQGDWEITHMDLELTGKVLFFKSLIIKSSESETDFRQVPSDLTFAQGLELLRKHEAMLAENASQNSGDTPK